VRQLADNVIKIDALMEDAGGEQPGGPRHGSDFQNLLRNKRATTFNLKDPRGLEVLNRLAEKADVVVENFRPDVKAKLGIDYESLRQTNPRIVYGSISGVGQDGPYHKRPGFDQIATGMGGLMSVTGAPGGGPMRVGIPSTPIGQSDLGKIHHRKRKSADELTDYPAPGDPAAQSADKRKLAPRVDEQEEYRRRNLCRNKGHNDDEKAAAHNDANDLADLPDGPAPGLNGRDAPIKSPPAVKRACQIAGKRQGNAQRHDGK
jgi:hypothetical protein